MINIKKVKLKFAAIFSLMLFACNNQEQKQPVQENPKTVIEEPSYDSSYAAKLGADEYGMKSYVMAFLKSGPVKSKNEEEAMKLQKAHLENIRKMAEAGSLVLAGPFLDDQEIRGIYIFNVATVKEAIELTRSDPAIQSGHLEFEMHPWYGSAALLEINDIHSKISKENP